MTMLRPDMPAEDGRVSRVRDLMRGFSVEATFPSRSELDAARDQLAPGTLVYLSSPPNHPAMQLAAIAAEVRRRGLEPVPHVAARGFASVASLNEWLSRLCGEADVSRVLLVAGDLDRAAGPFVDARSLICSDALQTHGITEIGIAGYPEGHPKIEDGALSSALAAKLEAAYLRGLRVHIVTQFCFDAERIVEWLRRMRHLRIDVPIRIGVAGPTSLRGLMRYALRCGVRASVKGMANPGVAQLLREVDPEPLIGAVAAATAGLALDGVSVHLFSFGGLANTARWARMTAAGREPERSGARVTY